MPDSEEQGAAMARASADPPPVPEDPAATLHLAAEQEARAAALHARSTVLLAHDHEVEPADFAAARRGGVTAKILHALVDVDLWSGRAAFLASRDQEEGVARRALIAFDGVLGQIEAHPDELRLVRSASDLAEAQRLGQLGILLGMEGGRPLEASLEVLRCYARLGVRHVQLNWGVPNRLAACQHQLGDEDSGLSDIGRALLQEMNRLGVVADTGHSSHRTRLQTYRHSRHPVIHSHAGAAALNAQRQNLSDEELKALADNGGVIGLHFMSHLIGTRGPDAGQATVEDLFAQIDYIARVAGMSVIGLGPDYLRYDEAFIGSTGQPGLTFVRGLERVDCLPYLTRALVGHGYRDADIEAILGGNLLRVLRAVLPA